MADREILRDACTGDDLTAARRAVEVFLEKNAGTAATQFAANQIDSIGERLGMREHRVAILSSFTVEPLKPHLAVREFVAGRRLAFISIPYEQWYQALSAAGPLDDFAPQVVVLLLHVEDILPLLAHRHLAAESELDGEAERLLGSLKAALDGFRARSTMPVVLSTFIAAERGVERFFDRNVSPSRQGRIDQMNARLSALGGGEDNVFVFDYAETVTDFGRRNWFDRVKDHHVGAAVAAAALPSLAAELSDLFSALIGPRGKVLAIDLDDTIWGGVVGEDGPDGIATAGDYPGNAFADFQAFLVNLRASGIALAAVSKNNFADVEEAFRCNPNMPLGWDDFATHRVDWNDKAGNLAAVAEDLGLGIDSIVFADNSPLECDLVSTYAPEVEVVNLDGAASWFPQQVLRSGRFYVASLTEEDRRRADGYGAERTRTTLAATTNANDFLALLDLQLSLQAPTVGETARVAQLFSKTNQFNLTTKRYTAADVMTMRQDPAAHLDVARLADRYGDYGVIGVVVTMDKPRGTREIDSFLISCRALGRNVEEAVLAELEARARIAGITRLIGLYVPTARNSIVAGFYDSHGFAPTGVDGVFERDLTASAPLDRTGHVTLMVHREDR